MTKNSAVEIFFPSWMYQPLMKAPKVPQRKLSNKIPILIYYYENSSVKSRIWPSSAHNNEVFIRFQLNSRQSDLFLHWNQINETLFSVLDELSSIDKGIKTETELEQARLGFLERSISFQIQQELLGS